METASFKMASCNETKPQSGHTAIHRIYSLLFSLSKRNLHFCHMNETNLLSDIVFPLKAIIFLRAPPHSYIHLHEKVNIETINSANEREKK